MIIFSVWKMNSTYEVPCKFDSVLCSSVISDESDEDIVITGHDWFRNIAATEFSIQNSRRCRTKVNFNFVIVTSCMVLKIKGLEFQVY